jgi:uncharacterized protein
MAAGSLLALLDDIASILDDVSVMTKVAAKKTAGVLGDDLALNAQQVAGVNADRELPVVWAVAKGSALNKAILVPAALLISAFLPAWVTTTLLMIGGAYLCFEGFEKVFHKLFHSPHEDAEHHAQIVQANADPSQDLVFIEKDKIKGAVRTDFILSAEIIVIALGTVANETLLKQASTLVLIAVIMTVGVYGLVAGIVKLDDLGLWLTQRAGRAKQKLGRAILAFAPMLMRFLTIAGTAAMFLVGGSIILHGLPVLHHQVAGLVSMAGSGAIATALIPLLADAFAGILVGGVCVGAWALIGKIRRASLA